MRLSSYFLPVLKETPAEAQVVSHRLMLRAGMIKQQAAGIYSWLPLGFKVLRKLENIIHEEQIKAGHIPIQMPILQSADLWRESGRYDDYGQEMLRIKDRQDRDLLYTPTAEEMGMNESIKREHDHDANSQKKSQWIWGLACHPEQSPEQDYHEQGQQDERTHHAILFSDNGVDEIIVRGRKPVPLRTLAGTYPEQSACCDRHAGLLRLKLFVRRRKDRGRIRMRKELHTYIGFESCSTLRGCGKHTIGQCRAQQTDQDDLPHTHAGHKTHYQDGHQYHGRRGQI